MGHYERVRCDNCNGTGTVGMYSGEGPKQCWSCGGTGYKGDVWVEDSSSSSSSYDSGSSSGGYSGGGGSRSAPASVPGQYDFEQGVSYENQGRLNDAVDSFTKALGRISYGKYKALAYVRRGQVYYELKQYDNAIEDFETAIGHGYFSDLQRDTQYAAYGKLGDSYKYAGQKEKAIEAYKEATYMGHPNTLECLAYYGVQYSLANHIEEKIANRLHNDPKDNVWYLADEWESATGRKMTKDEQVRIAGKRFPKRPKPSSSSSYSSSSYGEYSEGHPTLFGVIGAVVLGGIGYNMGRWVGAIIGGLIGWFVGRAIGSRISFGGGSSSHVGIGSKLLGVLFGIIGAAALLVIAVIVLSKTQAAGWPVIIGMFGGPIVGFILGWKISRSLAGKLIIIAVLIGGGLFFVWYNWSVLAPYFGKAQTVSETAATVNANVNFRAEPTTGDNIIRQLQQGDTVTLTGEVSGGWTQISHNGDTGWVSTEYLNK